MIPAARRGLAPRILLLLDQATFSLANFILTMALARHYPAAQFGAYGVALSTALVIQSMQRNLYVVSLSLMSESRARRTLPGILAKHLMVSGGAVALLGLAGLMLFGGGAQPATIDVAIATLSCIVVYFQADFDRAVLLKRGALGGALLLSVIYLAVVLGLWALLVVLHLGFRVFMLALAGACLAKGSWLLLLRTAPRWHWGRRFIARDWRNYGVPTVFAAAANAAYSNVPVMVLAASRGAAEVAGMMAMRSLTMPLNLVLRSLDAVDKNRFRSLSAGTTRGLRRVFWRTMAGYAAIATLALAGLAVFGHPIIALVYHGRYIEYTNLLIAWCVYCGLLGLMQPLQSVVMLAHRQMATTRWSTVSGVTAVIIAFAACPGFGAPGALTATIAAAALNVALSSWVVRDLIFGSHERPLPRERWAGRDMP